MGQGIPGAGDGAITISQVAAKMISITRGPKGTDTGSIFKETNGRLDIVYYLETRSWSIHRSRKKTGKLSMPEEIIYNSAGHPTRHDRFPPPHRGGRSARRVTAPGGGGRPLTESADESHTPLLILLIETLRLPVEDERARGRERAEVTLGGRAELQTDTRLTQSIF